MDDGRSYEAPAKPPTGCRCKCRADINGNIPENAGKNPVFAFGEAAAATCADAARQAKREATRALGAQPKHVGCKCSS